MNFNTIIHGISNKEFVDVIKYRLNIMLESQEEAGETEIVDKVRGRLNEKDKSLLKFTNSNKDKALLFCFKPYDYEIVECSISFDMKVKKHQVETEQRHLERRKEYIKFMAKQIERVYGIFGREKYEKRANAILNKYEEKNALEK